LRGYRYRLGESILVDVIDGADLVLHAALGGEWPRMLGAQVVGNGYEGYVAKEEASEYRGGPTRAWLKVKGPGWTDSEDRWKRVWPS
jgi:hypothetical protein